MIDATAFLSGLAADRDRLTASGPPSLTRVAAQVALMEAALATLAGTSPDRDASLRWLQVAGTEPAQKRSMTARPGTPSAPRPGCWRVGCAGRHAMG